MGKSDNIFGKVGDDESTDWSVSENFQFGD